MELKRVVITGIGAITPVGLNVKDTWDNIKQGVSGAAPITTFDTSLFKTKFACEVKGFKAEDHFDRKEARKFDRYAQFAIVASREAVADSGMNLDEVDKDEIGVILGVGIGGVYSYAEEIKSFALTGATSGPRFSPFFIPKTITDMASGLISIEFGFHGPNYTTSSACASASNAMIDAFNLIRLGKADAILTGGSEAAITDAGVGGFNALHALSTRNDEPETASRPFSASRDGFIIGEGAGILMLEELEHAKARGAKIYAEVIGGGLSADAHHMTASHPDGLGAVLVMKRALKDAGITADEVDYINVHGTSTHVGDISEAKAIKEVFGSHAYELSISSTKSMTGHLLGGAGGIEAIFSILSIRDSVVPPTINHNPEDVDPDIDYGLNFTFNKAQERNVDVAISNTFGFGGHNACVVFKKYSD